MKFTILASFILVLCFSCKKETKAPAPVSPPPKKCTATVNGVNWAASNDGMGSSNNIQSLGFTAQTGVSNPYTAILLGFTYTTGIVNLTHYNGQYKDASGTYFYVREGTINITTLDTSHYGIKKLQATFSFKTDTIGGVSYSITNGVIDYF